MQTWTKNNRVYVVFSSLVFLPVPLPSFIILLLLSRKLNFSRRFLFVCRLLGSLVALPCKQGRQADEKKSRPAMPGRLFIRIFRRVSGYPLSRLPRKLSERADDFRISVVCSFFLSYLSSDLSTAFSTHVSSGDLFTHVKNSFRLRLCSEIAASSGVSRVPVNGWALWGYVNGRLLCSTLSLRLGTQGRTYILTSAKKQ